MRERVKARLAALGKKQTDLMEVLLTKYRTRVTPPEMSKYLKSSRNCGPKGERVLELVFDILEDWEKEAKHGEPIPQQDRIL